jgi:hypothetical protein
MIASRIYRLLTDVRISFTALLLQNYLHILGVKTSFGHILASLVIYRVNLRLRDKTKMS